MMSGYCVLAQNPNCADFSHSNPLSKIRVNETTLMKGTHSAELGDTSLDCVEPVSKMAGIKRSSPSLPCFRGNVAFTNLHFFAGQTHYFRMIVETVSFVPLL